MRIFPFFLIHSFHVDPPIYLIYSRNLLNEKFQDGFLIYNDIFAIHTKYVCVHCVYDEKIKTIYRKSSRNDSFWEDTESTFWYINYVFIIFYNRLPYQLSIILPTNIVKVYHGNVIYSICIIIELFSL